MRRLQPPLDAEGNLLQTQVLQERVYFMLIFLNKIFILPFNENRKKRKKNNPNNSGHYVLLQRPRAAHALHSDQSMQLKGEKQNTLEQAKSLLWAFHNCSTNHSTLSSKLSNANKMHFVSTLCYLF
jgi:hypothetical protein